jgi:uncharacterized protein YvpB
MPNAQTEIDPKYIPLDKSWIIRMGILDIVNGKNDIVTFLNSQESLGDDLLALKRAALAWKGTGPIDVGESGTLYRLLKYASWKLELGKEFIMRGTLPSRNIHDSPDVVHMPQAELLKLDKGTSQWASAAVLLGDQERIPNPPFKLKITYEAVDHWKSQREKGLPWEPRLDETIANQVAAYVELLKGNRPNFIPAQAEDFCFAYIFGYMTAEEGEKRWPALRAHESDRIVEVQTMLDNAKKGKPIASKDHRVVQALAMWSEVNGMPVTILYKDAVNKSWPQFWDFLAAHKRVENVVAAKGSSGLLEAILISGSALVVGFVLVYGYFIYTHREGEVLSFTEVSQIPEDTIAPLAADLTAEAVVDAAIEATTTESVTATATPPVAKKAPKVAVAAKPVSAQPEAVQPAAPAKPQEATFMLPVPHYYQQYKNSCEAASLRMVLAYYGVNATDMQLVQAFGYQPRMKDVANNIWDDPQKMFVGFVDVTGPASGYGVYGTPVARVAEQYGRSATYKTQITAQEVSAELKAGHPVIMWGFTSLTQLPYTWNVANEGGIVTGTVKAFAGEHARVVVGFTGSVENPTGFYVNDSIAGPNIYFSSAKLMTQFNAIQGVTNQAVIVR